MLMRLKSLMMGRSHLGLDDFRPSVFNITAEQYTKMSNFSPQMFLETHFSLLL